MIEQTIGHLVERWFAFRRWKKRHFPRKERIAIRSAYFGALSNGVDRETARRIAIYVALAMPGELDEDDIPC